MPVEIYFVRDGSRQDFGPAYTKSLIACVEDLGLDRDRWTAGLGDEPRFGDPSVPASPVDEYKHVVCKIDDGEATASGWKAGYYPIDMAAEEIIARWGTPQSAWD